MARPKGQPKLGGRKKGTPNKATVELKDMIRGALDGVGGQEYLKIQALANPSAFMTLVGKTLPLQVAGDKKNPLEIVIGFGAAFDAKLARLIAARTGGSS